MVELQLHTSTNQHNFLPGVGIMENCGRLSDKIGQVLEVEVKGTLKEGGGGGGG